MTMTIEQKNKPTVKFLNLDIGQCFIDEEGDFCMRVAPEEEGSCVVLTGSRAGFIYNLSDNYKVHPIKLNATVE